MHKPDIADQLVDAVTADFADHAPGTRPVHTVGIGVTGYFKGSIIAPVYCVAEHFAGQDVPATVRFSNGSGSPVEHDGWSDARGMATRFHLRDGAATDLIAMTLREFFSATVDQFLAFARASQETPVAPQSVWAKIWDMLQLKPPLPDPYPGQTISGSQGALAYANHHRPSQLATFEMATIGAPVSYAMATYNAVHTFIVTGSDGTRRHVRFFWQPVAGVKVTDAAAVPVDRYLHEELRDRLAKWPAQFLLLMAIGENGDAFDDPTIPWPIHRMRVNMGTLTLTAVAADQVKDCETLGFNPCRLTPGIDLSNDPILACRRDAYDVSQLRRGVTPCPFGKG